MREVHLFNCERMCTLVGGTPRRESAPRRRRLGKNRHKCMCQVEKLVILNRTLGMVISRFPAMKNGQLGCLLHSRKVLRRCTQDGEEMCINLHYQLRLAVRQSEEEGEGRG